MGSNSIGSERQGSGASKLSSGSVGKEGAVPEIFTAGMVILEANNGKAFVVVDRQELTDQ